MKVEPSWTFYGLFGLFLCGFVTGCSKHIGDSCTLSTDCSLQGDRQCDTAEPNGYCTIMGCTGNLCPDKAACVLFDPAVPGCGYTDREPSRSAHATCMKQCADDSDCRTDEGYFCADPKEPPWNALILDDDQGQRICIPRPNIASDTSPIDASAPVCKNEGPDAGTIVFSPVDAGDDSGSLMTPVDAGDDASDAGDAD